MADSAPSLVMMQRSETETVTAAMLISVHIPKCAGTSFRHILQGL